MALGASRVSSRRTRSTCAARAKAASTAAASPSSQSRAMLPGASGQICGASLRHRARHVGDGRELPVLDRYGLGRIERLGHGLGDDEGHRLADVAHAGRSQGRHAGRDHGLAIPTRKDRQRRNGADACVDQLLAGYDGKNARHAGRNRSIHRDDVGMAEGRAHEDAMRLPRQLQVIGKPAGAGDEGNILQARSRTGPCRNEGRLLQTRTGDVSGFPLLLPRRDMSPPITDLFCTRRPFARVGRYAESGNAVFRPCVGVQSDWCMLTVYQRHCIVATRRDGGDKKIFAGRNYVQATSSSHVWCVPSARALLPSLSDAGAASAQSSSSIKIGVLAAAHRSAGDAGQGHGRWPEAVLGAEQLSRPAGARSSL